MKLDIPMRAVFYGPERTDYQLPDEYCFTHAVKRVLAGEKVRLVIEEGPETHYCTDCVVPDGQI